MTLGDSEADNEMTLALQRSREEHRVKNDKEESVISLCDSFEADDGDVEDAYIESAIIASMKENHSNGATNDSDDEDGDLKKAIELSLKTQ